MFSTNKSGILRKTDSLGRVVIPKELRRKLEIGDDDMIEIIEDGDCLILRKYYPRCVFCGSTEKLLQYNEKCICRKCIEVLSR